MVKFQKVLALLVVSLWVTGCEVYNDGFDLGSGIDECEASGGNCVEPTGSGLLSLNISNASPYTVKRPTNRLFDLSGLCNEADFSENIIEYTIIEPTTDAVLYPTVQLFNACKRGKFRVQINIPAPTNVNQLKRIRLEIVGRELDGTEQRNPLAAQKDIDVISL